VWRHTEEGGGRASVRVATAAARRAEEKEAARVRVWVVNGEAQRQSV
jgi:hypothetical protein